MNMLWIALALHTMDYAQTREIARNPKYHETNIFLGRDPSQTKVDAYFLATGAMIYWVSTTKHSKGVMPLIAAASATYVAGNLSIGLNIKF